MGSAVTLERVFRVVGHTYRSIDIRFAAVRKDETWRNAFAIVRFSYHEPGVLSAHYADLQARYVPTRADRHWTCGIARPFSSWAQIEEELQRGVIRADSAEIRLDKPIAVTQESGRLQRTGQDVDRWPALELFLDRHDPSMLYDDAIEREVTTLGYRDAYDIIRPFCERDFGSTSGSGLIISAPVFALIISERIDPKARGLHVAAAHHKEIADLNLTALARGVAGGSTRFPFPPLVTICTVDQIVEAQASTVVPEFVREDQIEFRLAHALLGEVDQVTRFAHDLLPKAERNVLFAALTSLCPPEKLEELLRSPAAQEKKKLTLNPSIAFELHISWLLGVLGLQTIVLGDYEYLVHPRSDVRRGSIDILAFDPTARVLIIAACTINPAKQEDFTNLLNVRRILEDEVLAETECEVKPVVFTGAKDQPRSPDLGDLGRVPVIDSDVLAVVFKRLVQGDAVRFLDLLRETEYQVS